MNECTAFETLRACKAVSLLAIKPINFYNNIIK